MVASAGATWGTQKHGAEVFGVLPSPELGHAEKLATCAVLEFAGVGIWCFLELRMLPDHSKQSSALLLFLLLHCPNSSTSFATVGYSAMPVTGKGLVKLAI